MSRVDPRRLKSITVLHQDEHLVVVAKPAGMAVHGGAGETGPTVLGLVEAATEPPAKLHLAHRLDKGTSGVLVFTFGAGIAKAVGAAWDRVEKHYLALALGRVANPLHLTAPLDEKDGRRLAAETFARPLALLDAWAPTSTLLAVRIVTGRTHQIRRHLQGARHPVLMDDRYGDFAANKAFAKAIREAGGPRPKHPLLHAWRLELPHPALGTTLELVAPPPPIWGAVLNAAGREVDVLARLP